MANLLLLIDPKSHDSKWLKYISRNHHCYVVLRKLHYQQYTKEQLHKVESELNCTVLGSVDDFSMLRFWKSYSSFTRIRRYIKKHEIKLFHIMYAEPNALWALFARIFSIPIFITTRGTDILKVIPSFISTRNIYKRFVGKLYKSAFRNASVITCTSHEQIQAVKKLVGNTIPNLQLIRTGAEFDLLQAFKISSEAEKHVAGKYILFPRSMRSLYNHEFSIEAIKHLSNTIKEEYKFVFVDRDSSDGNYVKKILNLMNNEEDANFVFLERQSQVIMYELMKNASIVIMNPLSDGTPVSALEAIALKKPVILGPLRYDEDLFDRYPYKLSRWDSAELAQMIQNLLLRPDIYDADFWFSHFHKLTNRSEQMKKLFNLYDAYLNI
jgi:glycosyltransferase involved in cell wall biosynthesis